MRSRLPGNLLIIVAVTAALAAVAVACGGGGSEPASGSGDTTAAQATSAPAPEPAPAPTATTPAEPDESGLVIKEVILDSGKSGGKLGVVIFNSGNAQCYGPTVNFELLRENGSVVARMGIIGEPLDAGAENQLNERYIGGGVVEASVIQLGCEHTSVSDTGAPQRFTTPFPTGEKGE